MANGITLSRLILLALAAILLYQPSATARMIAAALIVLTIILDGVDGWVARAWDEVSDLGSVLDIAVDRVVEQVLWIVYATLLLAPVWAPIIVVARGVMTDAIRSYVLAEATIYCVLSPEESGLPCSSMPRSSSPLFGLK